MRMKMDMGDLTKKLKRFRHAWTYGADRKQLEEIMVSAIEVKNVVSVGDLFLTDCGIEKIAEITAMGFRMADGAWWDKKAFMSQIGDGSTRRCRRTIDVGIRQRDEMATGRVDCRFVAPKGFVFIPTDFADLGDYAFLIVHKHGVESCDRAREKMELMNTCSNWPAYLAPISPGMLADIIETNGKEGDTWLVLRAWEDPTDKRFEPVIAEAPGRNEKKDEKRLVVGEMVLGKREVEGIKKNTKPLEVRVKEIVDAELEKRRTKFESPDYDYDVRFEQPVSRIEHINALKRSARTPPFVLQFDDFSEP